MSLRAGQRWLAAVLASAVSAGALGAPPRYEVAVQESYSHDPAAFTQGLVFADGELYESIGRYGESALRRVDPANGDVLAEHRLADRFFAEGLALVDERLIQLTWKSGRGFVYERETLDRIGEFRYQGEGWGLTYDGRHLIMSDGTDELRFLDPETFDETGRIAVTINGHPVAQLNELEWIDGEVWANVWPSDLIVRIEANTGAVVGVVDARGLRKRLPAGQRVDVLNGIAHDSENDRLFLTGKWWPRLFRVVLSEERPD